MCAVCGISVDTYEGGAVELLRIMHRGIPMRHGAQKQQARESVCSLGLCFYTRVHIDDCCSCCVLFRLFLF